MLAIKSCFGDVLQSEQKLYDHLLRNYNRHIRPVHNASDVITVRLGLGLQQLQRVDEASNKSGF